MKISKEQIQQIENYLADKNVEYIDLHFEVLDHISTDIENEMSERQIDFNEAFDEVKLKWNKTFSYKWTFWLGISNGGSKLFIDYCLKIYKPLWFKSLVGILLFIAVFYGAVTFFNINLNANFYFFKVTFLVLALFFPVFLIYWRVKLKQTKLTSVYSYLYYKQIFPNIFISLLLILQIANRDKESFSDFMFVYFTLFFSLLNMGYNFYKNHLKAVSNYKKYQLK